MNCEKLRIINHEAIENGLTSDYYPFFAGAIRAAVQNAEIDGKTTIEHQELINCAEMALEYAKIEKEKQQARQSSLLNR